MTDTEKKQPWIYQQSLKEHFVGQEDVIPQRLAFFNCTQKPKETLRERSIAKKTRYSDMTSPLQELMRDRLCTGVNNKDLRELRLHHYKEDGKTPRYTFEEQLARAKSWEAAHNTNITIMQSTSKNLEEQVHVKCQLTDLTASKQNVAGVEARHGREECPASKPGIYCSNCYMTGNHLAFFFVHENMGVNK